MINFFQLMRTRIFLGILLIVSGSLGSSWLWFHSQNSWAAYLDHANVVGHAISNHMDRPQRYNRLLTGIDADKTSTIVSGVSDLFVYRFALAEPDFSKILQSGLGDIEPNWHESRRLINFHDVISQHVSTTTMSRRVILVEKQNSNALELPDDESMTFSGLSRSLASQCTPRVLAVEQHDGSWLAFQADQAWSCDGEPRDYRLLALIGMILTLLAGYSLAAVHAQPFEELSKCLRDQVRRGDLSTISIEGPKELRDTTEALNAFVVQERKRLENRTLLLSGISHDLGSPATRLKLRAALIEDKTLRMSVERDTNLMLEMIEDALSLFRYELDREQPRLTSMTTLVESVVSDFQDIGHNIVCNLPEPLHVNNVGSVFSTKLQGKIRGTIDDRPIHIKCQPRAIRRALANLVDNALKYGGNAVVTLMATSDSITISVSDDGPGIINPQAARHFEAFQRGKTSDRVSGSGLGLTIVKAIIEAHGGTITLENLETNGLNARLVLPRNINQFV